MSDQHINDPPEPPVPPVRRSWLSGRWGLLLVASLALNLFIGGLVLGRLIHPPGPPPPAPSAMLSGPGGAFDGLDGSYRDKAVRRLKDRSGELRGHFQGLREAREAVSRAMLAEPFDRAGLEEAFAGLRAVSEQTQAALHGLLVDAAEDMPAKERGSLLRGISRRYGHD